MAFPDRPSRRLGLRPAGRAGAGRRDRRRQAPEDPGSGFQAGIRLRAGQGDRQPIWPIDERARAAIDGARRDPRPRRSRFRPGRRPSIGRDLPSTISSTSHPSCAGKRRTSSRRSTSGPLFTPPSVRGAVMSARRRGRRELGRGGARPRVGMALCAVGHQPVRGAPRQASSPAPRTCAICPAHEIAFRLKGPDGLPITKPPYGRITAIDLNSGDHKWMVPHGSGPRDHARLKALNLPPLGWPSRGFLLVTKTLLFAFQEPAVSPAFSEATNAFEYTATTREPRLRVFDKRTGQLHLGDRAAGKCRRLSHDLQCRVAAVYRRASGRRRCPGGTGRPGNRTKTVRSAR